MLWLQRHIVLNGLNQDFSLSAYVYKMIDKFCFLWFAPLEMTMGLFIFTTVYKVSHIQRCTLSIHMYLYLLQHFIEHQTITVLYNFYTMKFIILAAAVQTQRNFQQWTLRSNKNCERISVGERSFGFFPVEVQNNYNVTVEWHKSCIVG